MKLAVLCPGQGGQHRSMFRLALQTAAGREALAACTSAEFDPLAQVDADVDLFRNDIAQPLLCAHQLASWAALRALLPPPEVFAGYSVGELAAYGCVGALAPAATVRLARQRAAAMDACAQKPAPASGLAALRGLGPAAAEAACRKFGLQVAIVNGDDHVIVGGPIDALAALEHAAAVQGSVRVTRLRVGVAAHTSQLAAAQAAFAAALSAAPLGDPPCPVLAGVDASLVRSREAAIKALACQLAAPIQWARCMDAAYERGCRVFLELGACDAVSRIVSERFRDVAARSVSDFRQLESAADWAARALEA
ncbi:MAG TPA: acyltransferase domain-containing protein [Burkholderiaceae bacterium]|nr:acyltransferase domain-containing protein [Burkholderiaceae bacterium]